MTTIDGTLEAADGTHRLRFVRDLPHPPEKVWRALTDPGTRRRRLARFDRLGAARRP